MNKARVNKTYAILALDEDGCIANEVDCPDIQIDQYKGDILEVWKERADGFLFVYCNQLEIGYWVISSHVTRI